MIFKRVELKGVELKGVWFLRNYELNFSLSILFLF